MGEQNKPQNQPRTSPSLSPALTQSQVWVEPLYNESRLDPGHNCRASRAGHRQGISTRAAGTEDKAKLQVRYTDDYGLKLVRQIGFEGVPCSGHGAVAMQSGRGESSSSPGMCTDGGGAHVEAAMAAKGRLLAALALIQVRILVPTNHRAALR